MDHHWWPDESDIGAICMVHILCPPPLFALVLPLPPTYKRVNCSTNTVILLLTVNLNTPPPPINTLCKANQVSMFCRSGQFVICFLQTKADWITLDVVRGKKCLFIFQNCIVICWFQVVPLWLLHVTCVTHWKFKIFKILHKYWNKETLLGEAIGRSYSTSESCLKYCVGTLKCTCPLKEANYQPYWYCTSSRCR